ncbi:site-specific DNA-methyltransferase [Acinetobacter bereziniae]|uniref:site-specific DNA-methyltransferase n=1 Tax=Acinetobacter bereziniae TaxID=106648 RepID=UPI00073F57AF|nr:site-specific DNA-methyltransferase [Acinetobacter bereziniae]RSZ25169.1 site-specific DNA-methyltransferase [Acinetobacter bereziniae]
MTTEYTLPTEKITENSEQLAVLKNNFPQCFDKQGKFIVSKLQEILQADGVDLSRESYSLNWLGKSYARVLANEPIRTMLSEDTVHNEQEQNKNSHNLLIQGDNLEVLKHLKGAYTDKIKMIYIDPPYNTGSDGFVYQDDRSFSPEQFAELAGVELDEARRVLDFTQSNANSHSAWLTFIYPRLYIAKQLLKDDGVIFISIDDNEQAQLKILCNEVFGEANFQTQITRSTGTPTGGGNQSVVNELDYILVYSKDNTNVGIKGLPLSEKESEIYNQSDEYGRYLTRSLRRTGGEDRREDRPSMYFPVINPEGSEVFPIGPTGYESRWICGEKTYKEMVSNNLIEWKLVKGEWQVYQKFYLENRFKQPGNLWVNIEGNKKATLETRDLFEKKKIFDFPKPVSLIQKAISMVTEESNNSLILDFFAGSGTTAHAVLKQNAEDGGNRQFICVQIAEQIEKDKEAYKAGYRTIFEITKDRIIKASEKLAQDYPESTFERGFKIFKTCENFLPSSSYRDLKQLTLEQTNTSVVTTGFDEAQLQDILTTWKGLDKILLSENLNFVSLGNYLAYGLGHVLYLVNKGFNTDILKVLIQKLDDEHEFQVSKLVILGHHFDSKVQREIDEAMKNYNNKKSIPVDVVVRY